MVYEFIATLAAAFGMAGIALIIRHLSKLAGLQAPKWLIPLFAAIGIFAFQIHQEYYWYEQEVAKLPDGVVVVKDIAETSWYRPWSYVTPQVVRFMAADVGQAHDSKADPQVKLVNIYLFERRISTKRIPQVIDCGKGRRADYLPPGMPDPAKTSQATTNPSGNNPSGNNPSAHQPITNNASNLDNLNWIALAHDDPLFTAVCK